MKKLFSVILFLSSVFAASAAVYTGSCGANLTWTVDTEAQSLTISGTGAMYDYGSTSVPWNSYKGRLTSLVLEEGITHIGNYAFHNCSDLTGSLIIPASVTSIGRYAFYGCGGFMGSLTIPGSVTSIGDGAFHNCFGFRGSLTIQDGVTTIANDAFNNCFGFTGSLTIPGSVTSIGNYAFFNCSGFAGSLTIPAGVTTIGNYAFSSCSHLSAIYEEHAAPPAVAANTFRSVPADIPVYVPCGSVEAYQAAQYWSSFTNIQALDYIASGTCGDNLTWVLSCDGVLTISGTGAMDDYRPSDAPWYQYRSQMTSLVLEEGITHIGDYAFHYCRGFTGSLNLPNSLTYLGEQAFVNCSGLTGSLTIPSNVRSIGVATFMHCSGFTGSLTIPGSVTEIGNYAFDNCSGLTGNLVIPEGVTEIGEATFHNCSGFAGSLTIPAGVTTIGRSAFEGCSGLSAIYAERATPPTVYRYTFEDVPADIPVYVPCGSVMAYRAVQYWSLFTNLRQAGDCPCEIASGSCGDNLTWVLSCDGVLTISGTGAMYDYTASGGTITMAPWGAFASLLTSLVLEEGVTHIGDAAFYGCPLEGNLTLPSTLTSIGDAAFGGCTGFTGTLSLPSGLTSIGGFAFTGCTGFTGELSLPSGLTSIGGFAFTGCTGFTGTLSIPEGVTEIGYATFQDCSGITALHLPASVATLRYFAFSGCSGLTSITVERAEPATVIDADAFENIPASIPVNVPCGSVEAYQAAQYWSRFTNIRQAADCPCEIASGSCGDNLTWVLTCDYGLIIIGTGAMYDYTITTLAPWYQYRSQMTSLVLEEGITHIGDDAFLYCSGFTGDLVIPEGVTVIGRDAFYNCSGFTGTLTIPSSVTEIGEWAFYNCSGFTGNLVIPEGVTTIGSHVFWGCDGFTGTLTIPAGVTEIGDYAFYWCRGLTGNLVIPEGVTTIGNSAFYYCSGFTGSLTIPGSVTEIGNYAFVECSGLSAIYAERETPPTVYPSTFGNIPTTIPVYVPCGSVAAYQAAQYWSRFTNIQALDYIASGSCGDNLTWTVTCDYGLIISGTGAMYDYGRTTVPWNSYKERLTSLVLEEGITHIGNYAFYNCSDLTGSLIIPASVTSIGGYAFYGCGGFTGSLTIPGSVTTIGVYAFYYCFGLTGSLTIQDGVTTIANDAFYNCFGFTGSLTIPGSVTSIGDGAFYNCSGFRGSLTIPASVTSIGNYAFSSCSHLSAIYEEHAAPPAVEANTFRSVPTSIPVYVPCGSAAAYRAAQYWSSFTNITDERYVLTLSSEDEAKGTVAGTFDCPDYTLTATPAEGYTFSEWSDGNTDNPRLLTPTEDTALTAIFDEACSVIITSDDETMGTVSLSAD